MFCTIPLCVVFACFYVYKNVFSVTFYVFVPASICGEKGLSFKTLSNRRVISCSFS